ncbi:MAG: isocitrate/isopropylmalate dehydrogenase family protein [Euryarchaeota archaeon]|nr:isocitrate/isopropylmalate dehydrogenase family protein [Euryarchaeota archaeon]
MTRVAFLPGDGIGREVLPAARRVLEAAGFKPEWVELPVGWDEWRRSGDALPATTLAAMRKTDAAFFGAITSKGPAEAERELDPSLRGKGIRYASPILRLRKAFDLATNIRPTQTFEGNPNNIRGAIDMVIFRENTEDVYAEVEAHPTPSELIEAWRKAGARSEDLPAAGADTAMTARVITRRRTESIVRAAFDYAAKNNRRRVTLLEKANVMRKTGGLVQEIFRKVATEHPRLETEELQIDAACALCVRDPRRFDVVVATNLFGDIFSDLAAEIAGGLGLAPSANIGAKYALFEPVHGSAPDIAGKGVANPVAAILTGALLARHLGDPGVAHRVEAAVAAWFKTGPLTADLGGGASTDDVTEKIATSLGRRANTATNVVKNRRG